MNFFLKFFVGFQIPCCTQVTYFLSVLMQSEAPKESSSGDSIMAGSRMICVAPLLGGVT
jgi:hypothetical protein